MANNIIRSQTSTCFNNDYVQHYNGIPYGAYGQLALCGYVRTYHMGDAIPDVKRV